MELNLYQYYVDEVVKVIDADTIRVVFDLGFHLKLNATCRLYGINAPEVRGPEKEKGKEATECLKELIEGKKLWCRSKKNPKKQQGKYGRWLVDIFIENPGGEDHGMNVNRELIRRGHAVVYMADLK